MHESGDSRTLPDAPEGAVSDVQAQWDAVLDLSLNVPPPTGLIPGQADPGRVRRANVGMSAPARLKVVMF